MYFDPAKSANDVIAEIKKDPSYQYFTLKPTKSSLNGLTLTTYEGTDMCTKPTVIVIGSKFNYRFTYDCGGDMKFLQDITKSVKLLN